MQEKKRSKIRKPWLATILCLFTGPFGFFYFGWRPGLIAWLIFSSVAYFFRFAVQPKFATPPWIELFLPFIWAYAGWRYARSWNWQTKKQGTNYFGSFDAGIVATMFVVWLNILISFPVVAVFSTITKCIDGETVKGVLLGLTWLIGGLLWFYFVGHEIILEWTHVVKYLHFSKKIFTNESLDLDMEIKSGNNPLAAAILGLLFNGFGYLYFNWRYALLATVSFLVFILLAGILDFIGIYIFFGIPDWFKWIFPLVFSWRGFEIAVARNEALELGESTIEEMDSWPFAGMATSTLVEALGTFYAFCGIIWFSIDLIINQRIFWGILALIIAVPLGTYFANFIFGLISYLMFSLFYKKYEKNIFKSKGLKRFSTIVNGK